MTMMVGLGSREWCGVRNDLHKVVYLLLLAGMRFLLRMSFLRDFKEHAELRIGLFTTLIWSKIA